MAAGYIWIPSRSCIFRKIYGEDLSLPLKEFRLFAERNLPTKIKDSPEGPISPKFLHQQKVLFSVLPQRPHVHISFEAVI